jgi:hypothetical protein
MDKLRDKVVIALLVLPEYEGRVKSWIGQTMDEDTELSISHRSPAAFVAALPAVEVPVEISGVWDLRANLGVIVTIAKGASAADRDKQGWALAIKTANLIHRNTWGMSQDVEPAVLSGIQKNEVRDRTGKYTGVNYWTISFYNYIKFEALL